MSSDRHGHSLLTNRRYSTGASVSVDYKASLLGAAKSTEQGQQASSTYDQGKQSYDEGKGKYDTVMEGVDAATRPTPGERYSGMYWNSAMLASDPGMANLAAALDDAAAQSVATREARENDMRKRGAQFAAVAALFGPMGMAAGAVLYVAVEGAVALGKLMTDDHDSAADRERAKRAVERLWNDWLILPPPYYPELASARSYAEGVESILQQFDKTEVEPKWQEEWRNTVAIAATSNLPMYRDAVQLGWIPFSFDALCGYKYGEPGAPLALPGWASHITFGQCVTRTTKPGFLSAARATSTTICMLDRDTIVSRTDKFAAGIALALATRYSVRPEPVIEAAVMANRKYVDEFGPHLDKASWRMKGVFYAAWEAAGKAPKIAYKIKTMHDIIQTPDIARMSFIPNKLQIVRLNLTPETAKLLLPALRGGNLETRGFRELVRLWATRKLAPAKK